MPYQIRKVKDGYEVRNKDTGKVHAKHTTRTEAEKQVRLLEGVDHGWEPDYKTHTKSGVPVNVTLIGKDKGKRHGKAK